MRRLVDLQDDLEVAYARIVSVSVDAPRGERRVPRRPRRPLDVPLRRVARGAGAARPARDDRHAQPPVRAVRLRVRPDLTVHARYDGYWYLGRPTLDELRLDLRAVAREVRPDWNAPTP